MSTSLAFLAASATLQAVFNAVFGAVASVAVKPISQKLESTGFFNLDAQDVIGQYGENLVEKAKQENWTGVTGRDADMNELIMLLRQRMNPCITGEAGVGKTALIEGLAAKIAKGDVPNDVKDWIIVKVDFPSLIVGKGYGSDGSSGLVRLRALLEYATKHPNIVIFIDEVHQFANYAELCKTYLDRHQIKLVGATTTREFGMYVSSKDPALERRFAQISLEAPDSETAFKIIKDRVPSLEKKFNIKISDDILAQNVSLTDRYMPFKSSPDKEIKNLEVAAQIAVFGEDSLYEKSDSDKDKKDSDKKKKSAWNKFKDLFKKKKKGAKTKEPAVESKPLTPPIEITEQHLRQAVNFATRIPVEIPTDEENQRLFSMAPMFKQHMVAQDENIDAVCNTIIKARFEANDTSRIRGSFLFAGPSGVGKSYLTNLLATQITSSYVFNASQFEGDFREQVIQAVNSHPYCMLVFEGIDGAKPEIMREIAGIIDRGYAVNYTTGAKVSFKNAIVVSTINTGSVSGHDEAEMDKYLLDKLGAECLSKLGDVLVFKSLDENTSVQFVKSTLDMICNMFGLSGDLEITYDDTAFRTLVDICKDTSRGLRVVNRIINDMFYDLSSTIDSLNKSESKDQKILLAATSKKLLVKVVNK